MTDTTKTATAQHDEGPEERVEAGLTGPGEYRPAGEAQGQGATFSADDVAGAFEVAVERVHRAFDGEFGLDAGGRVDSREAQQLAEVILGDQPLDIQQAALMKLGAFTPRTDHDWGSGETAPGEESDRIRPTPEVPDLRAPR
jgi:hypothetical protein